jgi:hypothetical protein
MQVGDAASTGVACNARYFFDNQVCVSLNRLMFVRSLGIAPTIKAKVPAIRNMQINREGGTFGKLLKPGPIDSRIDRRSEVRRCWIRGISRNRSMEKTGHSITRQRMRANFPNSHIRQSKGPNSSISGPGPSGAFITIAGDLHRLDHALVVWRQPAPLAFFAIAASKAGQPVRRFTICRNHGSNSSNKGECRHRSTFFDLSLIQDRARL